MVYGMGIPVFRCVLSPDLYWLFNGKREKEMKKKIQNMFFRLAKWALLRPLKDVVEEAIIKDRKDTYRIVENISDSSSRPKADVMKQLWRRAYDKSYKS